MHELAICQALIDQVQAIASERSAQCVLSIEITIGPLSGVEPALLEGAFPLASAGTAAAGAELIVERSRVRVLCLACGVESEVHSNDLACRSCGHWRTQVTSGTELLLTRVELQVSEKEVAAHV
jgi:hydrogenase nickel incorporation protein HypA/HybF